METEIIARAYQLAPNCVHLDELRTKLKREGYSNVDGHFSSRQLKGELAKRLTHQQA